MSKHSLEVSSEARELHRQEGASWLTALRKAFTDCAEPFRHMTDCGNVEDDNQGLHTHI